MHRNSTADNEITQYQISILDQDDSLQVPNSSGVPELSDSLPFNLFFSGALSDAENRDGMKVPPNTPNTPMTPPLENKSLPGGYNQKSRGRDGDLTKEQVTYVPTGKVRTLREIYEGHSEDKNHGNRDDDPEDVDDSLPLSRKQKYILAFLILLSSILTIV
jgi:hypothetical protein